MSDQYSGYIHALNPTIITTIDGQTIEADLPEIPDSTLQLGSAVQLTLHHGPPGIKACDIRPSDVSSPEEAAVVPLGSPRTPLPSPAEEIQTLNTEMERQRAAQEALTTAAERATAASIAQAAAQAAAEVATSDMSEEEKARVVLEAAAARAYEEAATAKSAWEMLAKVAEGSAPVIEKPAQVLEACEPAVAMDTPEALQTAEAKQLSEEAFHLACEAVAVAKQASLAHDVTDDAFAAPAVEAATSMAAHISFTATAAAETVGQQMDITQELADMKAEPKAIEAPPAPSRDSFASDQNESNSESTPHMDQTNRLLSAESAAEAILVQVSQAAAAAHVATAAAEAAESMAQMVPKKEAAALAAIEASASAAAEIASRARAAEEAAVRVAEVASEVTARCPDATTEAAKKEVVEAAKREAIFAAAAQHHAEESEVEAIAPDTLSRVKDMVVDTVSRAVETTSQLVGRSIAAITPWTKEEVPGEQTSEKPPEEEDIGTEMQEISKPEAQRLVQQAITLPSEAAITAEVTHAAAMAAEDALQSSTVHEEVAQAAIEAASLKATEIFSMAKAASEEQARVETMMTLVADQGTAQVKDVVEAAKMEAEETREQQMKAEKQATQAVARAAEVRSAEPSAEEETPNCSDVSQPRTVQTSEATTGDIIHAGTEA